MSQDTKSIMYYQWVYSLCRKLLYLSGDRNNQFYNSRNLINKSESGRQRDRERERDRGREKSETLEKVFEASAQVSSEKQKGECYNSCH